MNAIDFIKQHGIDKAREVVEGAPDLAEYYSTIDCKYYRIELHAVNLRHLKRLVESVDLVESLGGIDQAKLYISLNDNQHSIMLIYRMITSDEIKQAIADYESIGGEHV